MLMYISTAVLVFLYLYYRLIYSRFEKHGVKHYKPLPLMGNFGPVIIQRKFFGDALSDVYFGFPGERFVGYYEFVSPVVLIRDIELMKKVAIQDFESFLDHRVYISDEIDPLFGRTLFILRGQDWKNMRAKLSPAFTSAKIKQMLPFMEEVGKQLTSSLMKKIEESFTDSLDIDIKDLSNRFANDIGASCAFGLKVDSISKPDNEFYKMGHKASNFSSWDLLKFFGYYSIPNIMKLFKISFLTADTKDFFVQLVLKTMKDRENRNIIRPDLIHLLMEARTGRLNQDNEFGKDLNPALGKVEEAVNGKKNDDQAPPSPAWTDYDLIAQALLFIIASYETISTTLSFLLYELAVNPHMQERLVQEIKKYKEINDGNIDYNTLLTMPYLDMVLSETLRLWPPAVASDRLCTKEYNLGRPNDEATEDFIVKVGEDIIIPIMGIHRDPEYFADPLKFDPERFSEENRHNIKPFTYIPFGLGPRNCIGNRFAVVGMKTLVVQLLPLIEVLPCSRTAIPAQLSAESFTLRLKGGHWLRLKARN